MLYQLILISSLGYLQPVATFDSKQACLDHKQEITVNENFTSACMPLRSHTEVQADIEKNLQFMFETINKLKQNLDKPR
jgi:serine/threonine protein kinase HipA of HipAB toxin-antitoxin module